jgi:nucleotide-binding universal stress UspA family protein
MYDNILIPTDGSQSVGKATEQGLEIAARFGATVHTLYVVEPVPATDYGGDQLYDALQSEGERLMKEMVQECENLGLEVETDIRSGKPHEAILDYADEHGIDLIVMGTHGRTGLDRYLLGSVTEKVVRLSNVPVLTVSIREESTD